MNKRLGSVIVSEEALREALHFPAGTRIVSIKGAGDPHSNDFEVVVQSELLRNLRDGEKIPVVEAAVEVTKAKGAYFQTVSLEAWNKKLARREGW